MTRGDFRTRVLKWLEIHGENAITLTADQNTFINEKLGEFSELTWCLWSSGVSLTASAGVYEYSLRGSAMAKKVLAAFQVSVAGTTLRDYAGICGPVPFAEMEPAWLMAGSAGTPGKWGVIPPYSIRFDKMPASGGMPTILVSGPIRTTDMTDDANTVEIPENWLDCAAVYVATEMARIRSTGSPSESNEAKAALNMTRMASLAEAHAMATKDALPPILRQRGTSESG